MQQVINGRRLKKNMDRAIMAAERNKERIKNTVVMKANTEGLSSSVGEDSSSSSSDSGDTNLFNILL